ncbi:hypothetical protein IB276_17735 [Ensifer sp. ENS04]|uniref:hypothetical protein n=1 Tax=Ensifer sp. ENS04 TaxID=2769281 RepID=UPI0017857ABE|nr:hypothetical protein [Ensifer sp. ENS04]MBD9541300.1 hypothetical protein [Ensifer sp. ENS04]
MTQETMATIHSAPDDPLGIDLDKDFNAEVRRIARDAEAVQAEVEGALRSWGRPKT